MPKLQQAQLRYSQYYAAALHQIGKLSTQGDAGFRQAMFLLEQEWPNIQAGQAWTAAHVEKNNNAAWLCVVYAGSSANILLFRNHPSEILHWLQPALLGSQLLKDRCSEGYIQNYFGIADEKLSQFDSAVNSFHLALSIARECGNGQLEGMALCGLGNAYISFGPEMLGEAEQYLEQAPKVAQTLGDVSGWRATLGSLGKVYRKRSKAERALEVHTQA